MNEETKVCPECNAEYYAHVAECSTCEVELVAPHEIGRVPRGEGALVCIEEGDHAKITELAMALEKEGYNVRVLHAPPNSCNKGGYGLFVPHSIARQAAQRAEKLWNGMFPEITEAEERLKKGLCPACGALLMGSSEECPDCGLYLGDPENCGGDGGCGDCGH